MHAWPPVQPLASMHDAFASAAERQTPSFAQTPMRLSMVRQ
jgi:hypothetical protein